MPPPRLLQISRNIAVHDDEDKQLVKLQKKIEHISAKNREWLMAESRRQQDKNRRIISRKIREAQLRKAALKLESKKIRDALKIRESSQESPNFRRKSSREEKKSLPASITTSISKNESSKTISDHPKSSSSEEISSESDTSSSSSSSSSGSSTSSGDENKEHTLDRRNKKLMYAHQSSHTSIKSGGDTENGSNFDSDQYYDDDSELYYADPYGLDSISEVVAERGPDIEDFDELQEDVENHHFEKSNSGHGNNRHRRRLYRDDKQPFVLEVSDIYLHSFMFGIFHFPFHGYPHFSPSSRFLYTLD